MNQINANAPTPGDIMELAKENERLQAQLAKANKKIRELKESEMDLRADCINLEKRIESERDKFAIEQQLKGITRVLACKELNLSESDVDTIILMKEQIRKEIEK